MNTKYKILIRGGRDAKEKLTILLAFGFLFTSERFSDVNSIETVYGGNLSGWLYFVLGVNECELVFSAFDSYDNSIIGVPKVERVVDAGFRTFRWYENDFLINLYNEISLDEFLYIRNMNAMIDNEEEPFTYKTPISEYFKYVPLW